MPYRTFVRASLLASALALPSVAHAPLRGSAPASVSQTLDGTTITIQYSRPRSRGRTLEQVFRGTEQWDKPWTPGANMATTLDVSRDVTLGGRPVPKATYSIWMVPRRSGDWTVILDQRFRRFHSEGIDSTADQVRFPVHTQEAPANEALTWSILELAPNVAAITMQWFTTRVTLDLQGRPSLASIVSAEEAAPYVGRYDVTCNRPSDELCKKTAGDSTKPVPLIISRENGRLTGRFAQAGQPGPFILARVGTNAFAFAWFMSSAGDVTTESPDWMTYSFRMAGAQATGFDVRNYANAVLASAARVTRAVVAGADTIRCRTRRGADGAYMGACMQFNTEVARLTLRRPAPSEPPVWIGTGTGAEGPAQPIIVDVRSGGALEVGRDWLGVTAVKDDGTSLEFAFSRDQSAPPTAADEEILRNARAYLTDVAHWNRADDNTMRAGPGGEFNCPATVARSMFCSLYLSSIAVTGHYAHWRPAVNALRDAIAAAHKAPLNIPLVAFNNDPATTLADVRGVLDAALKRIQDQRSGSR